MRPPKRDGECSSGKDPDRRGHNAYFHLHHLRNRWHPPTARVSAGVTQWQIEADASAVADSACQAIADEAHKAIQARGRFSLVLAGGGTPLETYRRLATSDQEWGRWTLYYGDERCLPPDDEQRNSFMVEQTGLTAHVGAHYPIPAELGAEAAATAYRQRLETAMPFDVVLLGVGEDGHTASLFPAQHWPDELVFAVHDAPKPPSDRVTLGVGALQHCGRMLLLAAGAGKRDALHRWRAGEDLPVARVSDIARATALVDRAGMGIAADQAQAT